MALSSPISETAAKRALNIAQDAPTDDDTSPIAKRPLFAAGAAAPKQLFDDISSSDGGEDSDEGDDLFEANPSSNDRPIASEGASSIDIFHARKHRSGCRFEYDYTAIESPQKRQRRGRSCPPPSPALHLSQSSTDAPQSSQGTPATPAIRRVTDIPGHYYNEDDDSDFDQIFDYSPTKFATSENDCSHSRLDLNKTAILHNDIFSARMAVISASTIESTVPEDDGDEMVDHPWTVLAKKTSQFIN